MMNPRRALFNRYIPLLVILAGSIGPLFATIETHADGPSVEWATQIGGPDEEDVETTGQDSAGNIYTLGEFRETMDFDPGPDTYLLPSIGPLDLFIQKMDMNGNFIWAIQLGASDPEVHVVGSGMVIDPAGNVYIAGTFNRTLDFDPGPGTFYLSASEDDSCNGCSDIFVLKLDSNGKFVWAVRVGGPNFDDARDIAVDMLGHIYVTGDFYNTADFDPGPGVHNLASSGEADLYVQRLDQNGNFQWAFQLGSSNHDSGRNLGIGMDGSIYLSGTYDSKPTILKLDPNASVLWWKVMDGASPGLREFTLDNAGNIYFTGSFANTVDFDPGPGVYNLTASSRDAFVLALTTDGDFRWAKAWEAQNGGGFDIELDTANNIYVTGSFTGTCDFDPGPAVFNLTAGSGDYSGYISKLDNYGNFIWAGAMPVDLGSGSGASVITAADDTVYVTGWFEGFMDADPTSNVLILTSETAGTDPFDVFTIKLVVPLQSNQPPVVNANGPYSVIEGGSILIVATATDPEDKNLTIAWDLDNNGTYETFGQSVFFSAADLDAPSDHVISVQATDSGGLSATDQTTLSVIYNLSGFFPPLDNLPTLNVVAAGRNIPIRFSLAGNQGLDIFAEGYPISRAISCDSGLPVDDIEETISAGPSGLQYDPIADQYMYSWRTSRSWSGTCRQLILKLNDNLDRKANFRFK